MAEEGAESANQAPSMPLNADIKENFACLFHAPSKPPCLPPCFFKIHDRLHNENEKAYKPEILSIGPYHHGKENFKAMEEHKLRYLKLLLERRERTSGQKQEVLLQEMVEAMRCLKKKARECYDDTPRTLEDDEKFVKMMLLDGCFIIELFRKYNKRMCMEIKSRDQHHDPESRDEYDPELGEEQHDPPSGEGHDPIFDLVQPWGSILRDLLLYENQLPFFILVRLVELIEPSLSQNELRKMALFCLENMRPSPQTKPSQSNITNMVLRFFSKMLKFFTIRSARQSREHSEPLISQCPEVLESSATMPQGTLHLLSLIHDSWFPAMSESESPGNEFIKCTSELVETGIKFEQAEEKTPLLDIKFNIRNGVMKIPTLCIDDNTECLFRNLIAYEQYSCGARSKRVTDYCIFMDRLINSAKDAQALRHRGIINNLLGDDEAISKMFNNLGNNVYFSENFCYLQVSKDVNEYLTPLKEWRASLMQKYFHSPWSTLSLLAAIFLLLLTVIQTIFAILPYV